MKTIEEIIAMFGGVDGLYVSIANEPFMRLVIEHIGEGPHGLPAISVAHYHEMNGDLCQDPEMCFEIESTQRGIVMHPYMFQMANPPLYQEVSNDAEGVALAEELRQFAATWDSNLRDQGYIQAAQTAPFESVDVRQAEDTMIDLSELSPEQLVLLIAKAKQILYPEAVIVGDELECSQCHKRGVPSLVEDGMTVTHDLDSLSAERIAARGWDGSSSAVSEEGDWLVLECPHCFQWHRIPENAELEWL